MRVGQLRERVTVQQFTETRNGIGAAVKSWSDVAEVWAEVRTPSGRELMAAAQMHSVLTHMITIRYRDDITAAMRVVWRGVNLEVDGEPFDPDGTRRWLKLRCVSGVRNTA